MAMTKIRGLQQWCRKMTEGYQNVDIANFTTAWRDGLAFCAIIHRFRPDLIDFDSLSPENVLHNNKLAFEVAEKELGIPAFLEADDMARLKVPDKLSVITYVSQYYNFLNALPRLGGPGVKENVSKKNVGVKRAPDIDTSQAPASKKTVKSSISPTEEALKQEKQSATPPRQNTLGDKCAICQNKVYLLERHIEEGKLYHRSCFRHSELSPTNQVFTRSPFMSPNLSSEKVAQENHVSKRQERNAPLSNVSPRHGESTSMTKDVAKSNLSSVLNRVEGAGMKHSITPSEREEDSKKSKFLPKSLFEEKETSKAKSGKEYVNKISEQKDPDPSSMLPLSGKEARKLEKRRQEILNSEKTPKSSVGAKRVMPLIFQQKEGQSASSTANISSSSSILTQSTNSLTKTSMPLTSSSQSGLISSKIAIGSLQSQKDKAHDKNNDHVKNKVLEIDTTTQNVLRKQSAPNIISLQQKFSGGDSNIKVPVAKPRISASKETLSKPNDSEISGSDSCGDTVLLRENVPKPAPRKSVAEVMSRKVPPERPKYSPRAKPSSSAESSSSADEKSTPRSTDSTSPPPLPTAPPPNIPSSQSLSSKSSDHPPPLPLSLPPSLPSKESQSSSTKLSSSIATSSSHPSVSVSTNSSQSSSTVAAETFKTPASKDTPLSSKPSQLHQISTIAASNKQSPAAVLVSPATEKNESNVRTGLLTSLAGIRGRSASTPSAVEVASTTTPTTTTSSLSSTVHSTAYLASSRKHSEPIVTSSLKPVITSNVLPHQVNDNSLSNAASSKLVPTVSTASTTKLTDTPTAKTTNAQNKDNIPEALSILSSLKPVPSSETVKTSKPSASSTTVSKVDQKQNKIGKSEIKQTSQFASNTQENVSFMKDIKRVMPESKTKEDNSAKPPTFNVNLKKVDLSTTDTTNQSKSIGNVKTLQDKKDTGEMSKETGKVAKLSNAINQPTTDGSGDIPQWKKDIEERKRKLKEDIARSEANTPSFTRHMKERPKSADILSLVSETKGNKLEPPSSIDESPRSDSSTSSSSSSSKRRPKSLVMDNDSGIENKLDWQLEAERKMAAFASFDSSEDESKSAALRNKEKNSKIIQGTSSKVEELSQNTSSYIDTKHIHVSEGRNDQVKEKLQELNGIEDKNKTTALKSTEKNTNSQGAVTVQKLNVKGTNLNDVGNQFKKSDGSPFNVPLRAVNIDISEKNELKDESKNIIINAKTDGQMKITSRELSTNNNNDIVSKLAEPAKLKLLQTQTEDKKSQEAEPISTVVSKSQPSSDNESLSENKTGFGTKNLEDQEEKDKEQDKKISSKLQRKITVIGRKDSDPKSPPPRRKITVDREFNFDNISSSSEFEASLTKSTANMNIHDEGTPAQLPPQRPPRPKSQKRNKTQSPQQISAIELQQQLMEIDNRLTDLELRGRDLEDSIRNVNTLEEDDEELMIQWFDLVREKNDLVRQEADLVYLSREQDLEDEQQSIDSQLRYLMSKEEHAKSPQEKEEEGYLLQRKIDIVNQRSSIVDSMDEDRLRYEEEDKNIEVVLLGKGLTRKARGSLMAKKGLKVAKSTFYA